MSRAPIVVPWKFCAQANHRLRPIVVHGRPRLSTNPEYSVAKQGAEYHIKAQWKEKPLTAPVELVARCWFPDLRRRDASNLAKMLGDAMSGIVYVDDDQIHRETYERAGIDRQNPRVEIEISELDADFPEPRPEKRLKRKPGPDVITITKGDGKTPKRKLWDRQP